VTDYVTSTSLLFYATSSYLNDAVVSSSFLNGFQKTLQVPTTYQTAVDVANVLRAEHTGRFGQPVKSIKDPATDNCTTVDKARTADL